METPIYELAERDYLNGMKYKEIAEKYNVSLNTVKSWKTRYKWCKEKSMHTKSEKVCTQNKKEVQVKKEQVREPSQESIDRLNKSELTDKQKLFCIYYIESFNKTKAYQKAYGCNYDTAMSEGHRLSRNPKIKQEIDKLTAEALKETGANPQLIAKRLLEQYIKIAFADVKDYVDFGTKTIEYVDKAGNEQEAKVNYINLNGAKEVDGTIITEVKQGKDGISIKLADKMKAMEFLRNNVGLLDLETRTKLALEIEKVKGDKSDKNQLAEAAKKVNARMSNNTKSDDKTE